MDTILFDLDGTLLPMDMEVFTKGYFGELARAYAPYGYEAGPLVETVWKGVKAMAANDGSCDNGARFWNTLAGRFGDTVLAQRAELERFYETDFHKVRAYTQENPLAAPCVRKLREKGYTVALATNPIFPFEGTRARLSWIGLCPEDFALVTAYENTGHCKPNLNYYRGVLKELGKDPDDCLMIGNDVVEDACVTALGMDFYLVCDNLINPNGEDLSVYRRGTFAECAAYLDTLPKRS